MTRKTLQGISIGIFFTTLILVYSLYFTDNFQINNEVVTFTEQDLEVYLQKNDLVAVNKTEYEQLLANVENKKIDELQLNNDIKEDAKEKEIVIIIKSGMTSHEVGLLLEEKGLINDYQQFADYLINNQLETKIKAGEYQLSTELTVGEIAELLT